MSQSLRFFRVKISTIQTYVWKCINTQIFLLLHIHINNISSKFHNSDTINWNTQYGILVIYPELRVIWSHSFLVSTDPDFLLLSGGTNWRHILHPQGCEAPSQVLHPGGCSGPHWLWGIKRLESPRRCLRDPEQVVGVPCTPEEGLCPWHPPKCGWDLTGLGSLLPSCWATLDKWLCLSEPQFLSLWNGDVLPASFDTVQCFVNCEYEIF